MKAKIFDIGLFDGMDTAYYLECGYTVVAVEANPVLAADAQRQFEREIMNESLIVVNAAISPGGEQVELALAARHLGSSSIFVDRLAHKGFAGTITVSGTTLQELFMQYGIPYYLKVDIEGADRLCILALTPDTRPRYISFELGKDAEELLSHLETIGYSYFKIINQTWFRELSRQRHPLDLLVRRLMRYMGYSHPRMVRRGGRFFVSGHSSGPLPWKSDGRWRSGGTTIRSLVSEARASIVRHGGWYDIHATIGR